jgi:hypothetical protein
MVLRAVAVGVASLLLATTLGCVRASRPVTPTVIDVGPAVGRFPSGPAEESAMAADFRGQGEVDVWWRGAWWPAIVLERRGDRFRVHYDGWGSEWDEVVDSERIRERRAQPEVDDTHEIEDDPDP